MHSIATDSKGNIYTTETYDGRRLQKFVYKGMQPVTKGEDQGTVWPKRDGARQVAAVLLYHGDTDTDGGHGILGSNEEPCPPFVP